MDRLDKVSKALRILRQLVLLASVAASYLLYTAQREKSTIVAANEKEIERQRQLMQRVLTSLNEPTKWEWPWVYQAHSIHKRHIPEYNQYANTSRLELLEELHRSGLRLSQARFFSLVKFYIYNDERRDHDRALALLEEFVKRYGEDSSLEGVYLRAVLHGLTLVSRDGSGERLCDSVSLSKVNPQERDRVISDYKKVLGSGKVGHPYYSTALNNLALLYVCLFADQPERMIEAEALAREAVKRSDSDYAHLDTLARVEVARGIKHHAWCTFMAAARRAEADSDPGSKAVITRGMLKAILSMRDELRNERRCDLESLLMEIETMYQGDDQKTIRSLQKEISDVCSRVAPPQFQCRR